MHRYVIFWFVAAMIAYGADLMNIAVAAPAPQGVSPMLPGQMTTTVSGKPYCLSSAPTSVIGYFIPLGTSSIISATSGVGTTITVTEQDGRNTYKSTVDTSVANHIYVQACPILQ